MTKNEGQNMTTPIVPCLVFKTVSVTRQTRGKREDKN